MPRHIGIVACSTPGATLCYQTICVEAQQSLGRHRHPEISMHGLCLADYMEAVEGDDWDAVAELMLLSARKLAGGGADFLICPDNTIHQAFAKVVERSPVPWLHIAEVVAAVAKERGFSRLAVLGTSFLMEGPVYADALAAAGLEMRIPEPEERVEINRFIFEELVDGTITDEARAYFHAVIERLKRDEGCDAVVLGCTEIPLLVLPETSPLPTLDSTRLLARAALKRAV